MGYGFMCQGDSNQIKEQKTAERTEGFSTRLENPIPRDELQLVYCLIAHFLNFCSIKLL